MKARFIGIGWRYQLQEYVPARIAIGKEGYWEDVRVDGDHYDIVAMFHRLKDSGRTVRVVKITTAIDEDRIVEPDQP